MKFNCDIGPVSSIIPHSRVYCREDLFAIYLWTPSQGHFRATVAEVYSVRFLPE